MTPASIMIAVALLGALALSTLAYGAADWAAPKG